MKSPTINVPEDLKNDFELLWKYSEALNLATQVSIADVERRIYKLGKSRRNHFLDKAFSDARYVLQKPAPGKDKPPKKPQNTGFTVYGGLSIKKIIQELEGIIDFEGDEGGMFRVKGLKQDLQADSSNLLEQLSLRPCFCFVSASFLDFNSSPKYQGVFRIFTEEKIAVFDYFIWSDKKSATYIGKFEINGGILFFTFVDDGKKKLYSFRCGESSLESIKYLHGVYVGDTHGYPVAGEVLLERVDNYSTAIKEKISRDVPDEVRYLLHSRQIRVEKGAFGELAEIEKVQNLKVIQQIAGYYKGYHLSHQTKHMICECGLDIKKDGSVEMFRQSELVDAAVVKGVVYYSAAENKFFLLFQYDPSIDRYRFSMILQYHRMATGTREDRLLKGSFGNARSESMPNSGRIMFLFEPTFRNASPRHYRINVPDEWRQFEEQAKDILPEVIDFLQGKHRDDFADDPYFLFQNSSVKLGQDLSPNVAVEAKPVNRQISEDWAGRYEAYIIQYYYARDPNYVLQKLIVEIDPATGLQFKSEGATYQGIVTRVVKDNLLLIETRRDQHTAPDIYICLQRKPRGMDTDPSFIGVYAGLGQGDAYVPVGGRIAFYPLSATEANPAPADYEVRVDNPELQTLFNARKGLFDFFIGDDHMMEGYNFFRETFLVPVSSPESLREGRRMAGVYLSFKLDSNRSEINLQPLVIYPNGRVRMLSMYNDREYLGVFNVFDNVFSLNFNAIRTKEDQDTKAEIKEFYAQSLFRRPIQMENGKYLNGVHLSKTIDGDTPFCCRQVITLISTNPDEFKEYRDRLQKVRIPVKSKQRGSQARDLQEIKKIIYQETIQFYNLEKDHHNILRYLMGAEDNMIVAPAMMEINMLEQNGFRKEFDYGQLFLIAAHHFATAIDGSDDDLALQYWEKAVQNGFQIREKEYWRKVLDAIRSQSDIFKSRVHEQDLLLPDPHPNEGEQHISE